MVEFDAERYLRIQGGAIGLIGEQADLTDADEIFLTSSSLGVAPVTTFDVRRYSSEGSITTMIASAFNQLIR